jgi:predicted transcriptional regulator
MKKSLVFEGFVTILLILLVFLLYVMVAGSAPDYNWMISGTGPVSNLYQGNNGSLYAFTGTAGDTIYSLDSNGTVRWKYEVPDPWGVINPREQSNGYSNPIIISPGETEFATDNGTMYLYIRNTASAEEQILAISDNGKTLWAVPLGSYSQPYSDIRVTVENGSIYAYSDYKVTVLNESGSVLFTVGNVSDPPAVDEKGNIYVSISSPSWQYGWESQELVGAIECYNAVGSVEWLYSVPGTLVEPDVAENMRQQYDSLPMYQNGLLYVPVQDGIIAMYTNGSVKWSRTYGTGGFYAGDYSPFSLFSIMPFDASGNVYLAQDNPNGVTLKILDKNGNVIVDSESIGYDAYDSSQDTYGDPLNSCLYYFDGYVFNTQVSSNNQITYNIAPNFAPNSLSGNNTPWDFNLPLENSNSRTGFNGQFGLDSLITYRIAAYDLLGNKMLWNYTIPIENTTDLVLNNNNINTLGISSTNSVFEFDNGYSKENISTVQDLTIVPEKNTIYLSFYTANYESPIVAGSSRCIYASNIYALGEDGKLIWSEPTGSFATSIATNNSTIYYGTEGGKIVSVQMNSVVGGIAAIALAYVFFRFFLVGAASRARDRLDKNENRNKIFGFIVQNPGMTIHEISRGTGVNLGTVRYHMLILGLNHKVVASQADGKYVRYFTNSNSYSKDEQLVLSLMRRGTVGKVLSLMLEKPGISNVEMAKELGLQESVVSRCVKELSEKGLVTGGSGSPERSVVEAHREHIVAAMRHLQG